MGKLIKELCSLLEIRPTRTYPYHPQSDRCLERWHGSLKAMIKKSGDRKAHWDKVLKYLLFSYRYSPHTNTGFSPFDIIYRRQVSGPVEVLKEGWLSGEVKDTSVIYWINELKEKLKIIMDILYVRRKE